MNRTTQAGRLPLVLLIIVSLLATGLMQSLTRSSREALIRATPGSASTSASLSNLNSFSLALLLGGLRGPLVMILWTSSESQKQGKDLEDFDTKIEMIRLLQPEFDSVHIFQIWNKAYNVSVQMASLANKYATILDGLDYAQRVDHDRPHDLNIIAAIGQVYFDKLGSSEEKKYYAQRVMEETRWRTPDRVREGDPGWRRYRMDPMLDAQGNILPQYLAPRPFATPIDPSPDGELCDGSDLQYLKSYQPFPYGIPPMALGYNYYKRAQVLKDTTHQKHLQLSDMVVDDRPAVTLKLWAEWEWEYGRQLEMKAFGKTLQDSPYLDMQYHPPVDQRPQLELDTAPLVSAGEIKDRSALLEAMYCYQMAVRLEADAIKEYDRHLRHYTMKLVLYQQHKAGLRAMAAMLQGDYDSLSLDAGVAKDRSQVTAHAIAGYQQAVSDYQWIILKFYTEDETAAHVFPPGVTRASLTQETFTPQQQSQVLARSLEYARAHHLGEGYNDDRKEYIVYLERARVRLSALLAQKAH